MYLFFHNANFVLNVVVNTNFNFHNVKITFNGKLLIALVFFENLSIHLNHNLKYSRDDQQVDGKIVLGWSRTTR